MAAACGCRSKGRSGSPGCSATASRAGRVRWASARTRVSPSPKHARRRGSSVPCCARASTPSRRSGGLPSEAAPVGMTFREAAEALIGGKREEWRNAKHAAQWENTLARYAYPVISQKLARDVTLDDLLAILRPIWTAKGETA